MGKKEEEWKGKINMPIEDVVKNAKKLVEKEKNKKENQKEEMEK